MSFRERRSVVVASLTLTVLAAGLSLSVQPALSPSRADAVEPDDSPLVRADPASAKATALATGRRVEDLSRADGYNAVYAEPDGTWTAETTSEPIRAKNGSGDWAPIDTTLVERNGRLEPKNSAADVSLSNGGDRGFAKAAPLETVDTQAGTMTWQWPSDLPEPVVDGATATYVDAVPGGGDLVVIATATGFTHNVVLHEPPAADAPPVELTVPVTTPGAELRETADGALVVKTNDAGHETLAAAPAPVMWDSSDTTAASPDPAVKEVDAHLVDTSAGGKIVLTPDAGFLNDPATVYPVTIDPTFSVNATADTWVMREGYTSSQSSSLELRAGTYDGTHLARSFLKFPGFSVWGGEDITAAAFSLRNFSSGSCAMGAIRASRIMQSWDPNTLTWGNQPDVTYTYAGQESTAYGYDSSCPAGNAEFSITDMVKLWAAYDPQAGRGASNQGIRLSAVTETNPNSWRRYRSTEWTTAEQRPLLKVNWTDNTPPPAPTVSSLNVTDGEYADPLPPAHAFSLATSDAKVSRLLIVKDGGAQEAISASGGKASYPWSPGFGEHTLSVVAEDPAGNRSPATTVSFSVREFVQLDAPTTLAELTLAAGEVRSTDVAPIPDVSWDDVESLFGFLDAGEWTPGQAGSVSVADARGTFPTTPAVSWTTDQSPTTGSRENVSVALDFDDRIRLRNNAATTGVSVALVITGWWRLDPMSAEDDAENAEDELEQVDDPGDSSGDGDEVDSSTTQTCTTTDDPTVVFCESAIQPEQAPSLPVTATTAQTNATASAAEYDPWPDTPSCEDKTRQFTGWTTSRFKACNYSYRKGKMYIVSRSGAKKVGEWEYALWQNVWLGHLTRRMAMNEKLWLIKQSGALKGMPMTAQLNYDCNPNCADPDVGAKLRTVELAPGLYEANIWLSFVSEIPHDGAAKPGGGALDSMIYTSVSWSAAGAVSPGRAGFPRSNIIRCDNEFYFSQRAGCRFIAAEPTLILYRRGEGIDEAAEWYKYFQDNIYAWGKYKSTWFTRAEPWEKKKNRNKACSGFKKTKSCDEFPFAVTKQGCWTNGGVDRSCTPGDVLLKHNTRAGAKLGAFLRRNRILRSDPQEQFYVRIK